MSRRPAKRSPGSSSPTNRRSPARAAKNLSLDDLLTNPDFFLFDTLPQHGKTRFLQTDESEICEEPFLDIRFRPRSGRQIDVSTLDLIRAFKRHPMSRPQVGYIFHHAFVCSTLLARALNQSNAFVSLKEPWILRRLSDIKRQHGAALQEEHWRDIFGMYLDLLAKDYRGGRSIVVKATNVANNLMPDMIRFFPDRPILYLYSSLEEFLVSNLKKTADTQVKMPGLMQDFAADVALLGRFPELRDGKALEFLQVCAAIWICNAYQFKVSANQANPERISSLDMDDLLNQPERTVPAVAAYFGQTLSDSGLEQSMSADIWTRHAKEPSATFDAVTKQQQRDRVYNANKKAIDDALRWAQPIVKELDLERFLDNLRIQP